MSASLESETSMIYAHNLDQTHELDVAIGYEDWVEDFELMPSLCIHASCESSRFLFSTLSHVAYIGNSYYWA